MLGFGAIGQLALGQAARLGVTYTQTVSITCTTTVTISIVRILQQLVSIVCTTTLTSRLFGWVSKPKQNETWTVKP